MWYLWSWRDLRRRSNAGHGLLNKPEITPPSHSNHHRAGTLAKWSAKECGGSEVTEDMTSPAANQPMMVSPTNLCVARGFFRLGKRSAVYAMTGNRLAQRN